MRILETAYHRNGIGGVPFLAVTFTDWEESKDTFLAIIPRDFCQDYCNGKNPEPACYVVSLDLLPSVTFGVNSWRGDRALYALLDAGLDLETGEVTS